MSWIQEVTASPANAAAVVVLSALDGSLAKTLQRCVSLPQGGDRYAVSLLLPALTGSLKKKKMSLHFQNVFSFSFIRQWEQTSLPFHMEKSQQEVKMY